MRRRRKRTSLIRRYGRSSRRLEVPFSDPSVRDIVRAGFPDATSHRTVKVEAATRYQVSDYWSEGSRNYAAFVELATMHAIPATSLPQEARQTYANPFNLAIGEVAIPPGYAVVEHMIFVGKDHGYRVYLNPANFAPMLPAKAAEVPERDRRILVSIRSLKSGPYRQEALAALGCTEGDLDRLAAAGLLKRNKLGATSITAAGRAACADEL